MSNVTNDFRIEIASDTKSVEALFREYASELDIDFCFQGFEDELAVLPGKYSAPKGAILVAVDSSYGREAGTVALRPFGNASQCEMKRMYVRPEYRGNGLGRLLAVEIIAVARTVGYSEMLLDTLQKLHPAIQLYKDLGFEEIEAYYDNPTDGVVFMRKSLFEHPIN